MRPIYIVLVFLIGLSSCQGFLVNRRNDMTPNPPPLAPYDAERNIRVQDKEQAIITPPEEELAENIDRDIDRQIPPGVFRIRGTVKQIYPILESGAGGCAKEPCLVAVKVDTLIGRGATTPTGVLETGQDIDIFFRYTTAPSSKYFPQVKPVLPGVKVGTKFRADISIAPESTESRKVYEVYTYKIAY